VGLEIRLIVSWPPGGTVDVNARILGPAVSKSIGQQIVIDNRAGASGIIGTAEAARARPDGYTLLINTTPLVTNTLMYSKVPYNVLKDFEAISILSTTPSFVSVHPSVPARSVRELLALARPRPGALNYAGAGTGTNPHIAGELFNLLGKVNIQAVQFKGGGPALFVAWFVLAAPKGTPREIILALNDHFRKAMASPDTIKRFEAEGLDVVGSSPERAAATMESELKKYAVLIRERGMKAD